MTNAHSSSPATWQTLAEFNLSGQPGVDRLVRDYVATAVHPLNLSPVDMERLQMAVAEAVLNAIEYGNRYRSNLPVSIRLRVSYKSGAGPMTDQENASGSDTETASLTAKVSDQESLQGWGFFLNERVQTRGEETYHDIELFLYLE